MTFEQIWIVDTEYRTTPGEPVEPVCLVARELHTGRELRLAGPQLRAPLPPELVALENLYVAYVLGAEMSVHHALGWPLPVNALDLFVEHRAIHKVSVRRELRDPNERWGLIDACRRHGVDDVDQAAKDETRELILSKSDYTGEELDRIIRYCASDVDLTARLFEYTKPEIRNFGQALHRGENLVAMSRVEHRGLPIDVEMLERLKAAWTGIKLRLIEETDRDFGVYAKGSFKSGLFIQYLERTGLLEVWPRLASGGLSLRQETFDEIADLYPQVKPLARLRRLVSQIKLNKLAVGSDGRNRVPLWPYSTNTARCAPSNSEWLPGLPRWLRFLIKPKPGRAVAYLDYDQQEICVAAGLSQDPKLVAAMQGGRDPYLDFGVRCGRLPPGARREDHETVRAQLKTISLGMNYGAGVGRIARSLDISEAEATQMLLDHKLTYRGFWSYVAAAKELAYAQGYIATQAGWPLNVDHRTAATSIQNFPFQANAAEMLYLAVRLIHEAGVEVITTVHDAVVIESDVERIDADVAKTKVVMREAAELLIGLPIEATAKVVRYPDRFESGKGREMWEKVCRLLAEVEADG